MHHKLKEITENILVSETELLDMTGLINYEIIQVDRQMMEIKQEILKRKMNIPNIPREFREASPFLHVALQQEERGMPTP